MSTAYISGHLDLTGSEWLQHYSEKIKLAVEQGHSFVVGDAKGCDATAQFALNSLRHSNPELKVTVFHMFDSPRNNNYAFPTVGGFTSDKERDEAMTASSDYDIAWVRPGRENSGTAKNIARRGSK